MKRILISAVAAGALLGQLSAFEVVNDGEKSLSVFGAAKAVVGYGYNFSQGTEKGSKVVRGAYPSEFIYGIQGNSRIGLSFTYGKLFGAALLGAGESTFYKDGKDNHGGFRQLYAGYDFGDMGKILAGKNEIATSMGGFSSSIFDTESGLQGFGGTSTSTRRFQIAYMLDGFTISVSENDVELGALGNKSIPRFNVSYDYKADGLVAKVAASYTNASRKATQHIALVTAGAKYNLGDAGYVSGLLTYGLNSQLVGESKVALPSLSRGFGNVAVSGGNNTNIGGNSNNTHIASVAVEYGTNLTDDLKFIVGGGYQYATHAKTNNLDGQLHSYSAFVQTPYNVGGGFSIIPQVGYLGTTAYKTNTGNVLAEVLFNLVF